jgi:serine/threonine protein kinase
MCKVSIIAKDGSMVEFIKKNPKQGAVKDVYFSPDRSYVVAFYRRPLDANGHARLDRLVGQYRQGIFGLEGGEFWKNYYRWPEKIVEYDNMTGVVVPVYSPNFFFGEDTNLAGAEKEGKWFTSAKNFNRFVPESEKGDLLGYLKVCLNLSRAVRRLHAAGLAHSDLSYKNCLVDPKSGEACVIDIDGLVVPKLYNPDVLGTPDFMAPEVIKTMDLDFNDENRKLPCRETDLHALATLIYQYLFHRHPLRGSKVHSRDLAIQESLEMGAKALFVENPKDASNRYKIQKNDQDFLPWIDAKKLPYTIMGPYLKTLFEKAFIEGLHEPNNRPSANDWEEALVKTTDLLHPCPSEKCVKKWYVIVDPRERVCPYCGAKSKGQSPFFNFSYSRGGGNFISENHRLSAFHGLRLYAWHVFRNVFPNEKLSAADKQSLAYVIFHDNQWILVNQALKDLYDVTRGKAKLVPPGVYVPLTNGLKLLLSDKPFGRVVDVSIL